MKKILVTQSSMPSLDEYVEEIKDMWDTHWLTNMGPKHKKFQEELTQYLGVENIDLMTNGHMALELSLQALNLSGEVITTPFTFASTTHAIVRNGLDPVFCDIDPVTYTMDTTKLESLITDKTCAIMPGLIWTKRVKPRMRYRMYLSISGTTGKRSVCRNPSGGIFFLPSNTGY